MDEIQGKGDEQFVPAQAEERELDDYGSQLRLHEVHFVPLRAQSNIYSVVPLTLEGKNKVLVATIRGEISCLEFHSPAAQRPPSFTPINFTYIPVDAEIVSMDAITKEHGGIIVGVTLIKTDAHPKEVYCNLYGIHCDPAQPFQWERVAEDWYPLTLKFIPFQLTHTKVLAGDQWDSVFLLAGDDLSVHMYREFLVSELTFAEELSPHIFFPEFQELPSSVTNLDMKVEGTKRLSVFGCQNGFLKCCLVDIAAGKVVCSWSSEMVDGPITSVKLFTLSSTNSSMAGKEDLDLLNCCHLLVASAVEIGVVFMNVLKSGFSQSIILPSSQQHDSVLCSCVADLNWDGVNELVLGTFGRQVLVYQFSEVEDGHAQLNLLWRRGFAHPVHHVWYSDLTHDGLAELVVVTTGGVHIMQHDLGQARAMCVQRLKTPDAHDVEDFLSSLMDQEFDTIVDDGSVPEVSKQLVELWHQWKVTSEVPATQSVSTSSVQTSNVDMDETEESQELERNAVEDDDGWTVVSRKR